jgi:hypothetical protein
VDINVDRRSAAAPATVTGAASATVTAAPATTAAAIATTAAAPATTATTAVATAAVTCGVAVATAVTCSDLRSVGMRDAVVSRLVNNTAQSAEVPREDDRDEPENERERQEYLTHRLS